MSDADFESALKGALTLYCQDILKDIPTETDNLTFSPRFEKRMKSVIYKSTLTPNQIKQRFVSQVAIIILVFTVGITALMSVEAIRVPVLRFFTEVHQTFTRIMFGTNEEGDIIQLPTEIVQVYLPGYIPEDYDIEFELFAPDMVIISYTNGADYFEWNQFTIDTVHQVNMEGVELEHLAIDGREYLYYSNLGRQNLLWEEYGYHFSCSGTLSKEILLFIAEEMICSDHF